MTVKMGDSSGWSVAFDPTWSTRLTLVDITGGADTMVEKAGLEKVAIWEMDPTGGKLVLPVLNIPWLWPVVPVVVPLKIVLGIDEGPGMVVGLAAGLLPEVALLGLGG